MIRFLFLLAAVFLLALPARAYVLEGQQWPNGTITMNLQLSSATYPLPTNGLQDGSASWNVVAEAALAEWNQYLKNVQFAYNTNTLTPGSPDHINSVFFSNTVFGQSFGSGTLGITVRWSGGQNVTTEADTVINTAFQWDSYRGNLRPNAQDTAFIFDIRRVLDHELGHNLGLNHPDLAAPPQTVNAIMNSMTSNLDHIELDDIEGVWSMYGQKSPSVPVTGVANPAAGGTINGGGNLPVNTVQNLTAVPAAGYAFLQWDDGSTSATRSITVPVGGGTYTATFVSALDSWLFSSSANAGPVGNFREILFNNGLFQVFGTNGMLTSADGITWTQHPVSTAQNYNNNIVAYHGGIYVSVGQSNNNIEIWSSTDGVNWTDRSPSIVGNLQAVTWGKGLFVAVGTPESTGDLALILTSPDGVNWTQQTQGVEFAELSGVVYANGIFLAVGDSDFGTKTMSSPDGINWTTVSTASQINLFNNVVYGNGHFLAAVNFGHEATSLDGVNWTLSTDSYFQQGSVGYGNGIYFFWENNVFATSTDGLIWPFRALADNSDNFFFVYGNGRFVGTGEDGIQYSALVSPVLNPVLPVVHSATTCQGTLNTPLSYQIAGTNTPLAFNAVGLPAGLSINVQTGEISGTPTVTGTFPVTLFATNDAGSGTATLTLTVAAGATPQTFDSWATANNVTGGMSATPRNDGIPNLLKYVYDIDPTVPVTAAARGSLPVVATASSGTQLTLTFPENKILENVGVAVQTSTDMVTWGTPNGASITPTGNSNASGDPIMLAQAPITASKQFIRLVVTPQ